MLRRMATRSTILVAPFLMAGLAAPGSAASAQPAGATDAAPASGPDLPHGQQAAEALPAEECLMVTLRFGARAEHRAAVRPDDFDGDSPEAIRQALLDRVEKGGVFSLRTASGKPLTAPAGMVRDVKVDRCPPDFEMPEPYEATRESAREDVTETRYLALYPWVRAAERDEAGDRERRAAAAERAAERTAERAPVTEAREGGDVQPAHDHPPAALTPVLRRSFNFFDTRLVVRIVGDSPGELTVVRGEEGRVHVTAHAVGGAASAALSRDGARSRLSLTGTGTGQVAYVVAVPRRAHVEVLLPDEEISKAMNHRAETATFHWPSE